MPVRLNDDPGTNSQFNPAIAVDQASGAIGISWYDSRNDLGQGGSGDTNAVPNDDAQIWGTISVDGGAHLRHERPAQRRDVELRCCGKRHRLRGLPHDAFVDGVFYPCWSDNSNSTGDNPDGALSKLDLYISEGDRLNGLVGSRVFRAQTGWRQTLD